MLRKRKKERELSLTTNYQSPASVTVQSSSMANSLTPKSAKAIKTTFNVGLGVNAVSGMYEYGAGYDLFAANKTIGHQGTLKVRVNF